MQPTAYSLMAWRTLSLAIFFAALCLIGNFIVVLGLRGMGEPVVFASSWALLMFCLFMGLLPFRQAGSRISASPIDLTGRTIIFVECSVLVAAATFVSVSFVQYERIQVRLDIEYAPVFYLFIAFVMLLANFRRLRAEIRLARLGGRDPQQIES